MVIKTAHEYIDFFTNLNMGEDVPLLSFVNNERRILKQKLSHRDFKKEPLEKGLEILDELAAEISKTGQDAVLEKYKKVLGES